MSHERVLNVIGNERKSEQEMVDYIEERLKSGLGITQLSYLGVEERSYNYLFRFAEKGSEKKKIFVKLSKTDKATYLPGHGHFSVESFNTLSYLKNITPENSKLAVPIPYLDFSKYNGFAREWVEGESLVNLLRLGRWSASKESKSKLKEYFHDVGEAIGGLHLNTYDPKRCIAHESVSLYMNNLLAWSRKYKYNPYMPIVTSVLSYLRRLEKEISWDQVGTSWVHGDLIPANIILTKNGKATIIDYEHARFDSPLFDASWFVVRTMIDLGWMPHKYSNKYLNVLSLAFLEGYLGSFRIDFDEKLFRLYCILNTLQCIYVEYNTSLTVFLRNSYATILLKNYLGTYKSKLLKRPIIR